MAAPGIIVRKTFKWRGDDEEWANVYHFQGDAPDTPAGWRALCDDFIALEKTVLRGTGDGAGTQVTIESVLCYENTDDDSVYTYDLAAFGGVVNGTYGPTESGYRWNEGSTAYMARWGTGRTTSKSKPIYLRKYYHPLCTASTDPDLVITSLKNAVDDFAEAVMTASGDWPGLAGPDGNAPTGWLAMPYGTNRDLKRRGRRPTSP